MEKAIKGNTLKNDRLMSIDILRGFDMFWIIGGGALITYLAKIDALSFLEPLSKQMSHVEFEGFRFWDLIFPLFIFISGVTIPFSLLSKKDKGIEKPQLQWSITKRAIKLIILGVLYNGILQRGFTEIRFTSVLGQIGIAYFIGATIALQFKSMKTHAFWLIFIIILITALQVFAPVPGYGAGHFDPIRGMNAYLDQMLLPGHLSVGTYDRIGILCIISASALVLIGYFAGSLLRNKAISENLKTIYLASAGVIMILLAIILWPVYPVIKDFWTTTFNLLTAGISLMLLSLFYYVIDVKQFRGKVFSGILHFFRVIGLNSITIYMADRIIPFGDISKFFTGSIAEITGAWLIIAGAIIIKWMLLNYLYKQKIFLKV